MAKAENDYTKDLAKKAENSKTVGKAKSKVATPAKKKKNAAPEGHWYDFAKDLAQFFREVRIELGKVTWPGFKETRGSTVVVIVLIMVVSLMLFAEDNIVSYLMKFILK